MYVMIIVLKNEKLLKKLVSALIEFELYDCTVLDGEGIENLAAQTVPLYSAVEGLFGKELVYNKTCLCYVPDFDIIQRFEKVCKKDGIDFTDKNTGMLMAFPCAYYLGPEEKE